MQGFIPLKGTDRVIIEGIISKLSSSKRSICEGMIMAMEYASNAKDISEIISD